MKISELILILKELDPETLVVVEGIESGYDDFVIEKEVLKVQPEDSPFYYGKYTNEYSSARAEGINAICFSPTRKS